MSFGYGRYEIGSSHQRQRRPEASYDGYALSLQTGVGKRIVDRRPVRCSARPGDVLFRGVSDGRDVTTRQRMPSPHDSDEPVSKERLSTYFRAHDIVDNAGFEVDAAVAQTGALPINLRNEAQANPRRLARDACQQCGTEILDEAIAGPQRERRIELSEVKLLSAAQDVLGLLDHLSDPLAQFERPWCQNKPPPSPNQQRITRRRSQPRQSPAHGRCT